MTDALNFEHFVCNAFGYKSGTVIGRYGDPALLADADIFIQDNLARVKAATIYAMEIFKTDMENQGKIQNDAEHGRLDAFADRVLNAPSLNDISDIISEFERTVIGVYFVAAHGIYSLR